MRRSSCATFDVVSISWNTPRYAVCRLVAAVVAQQPQDDGQAVADRQRSGAIQAGEVVLPRAGVEVQPVVIGGQVELADAAGNRGALLDHHQPLVVAQVLADLARSAPAARRRRWSISASSGSSTRVSIAGLLRSGASSCFCRSSSCRMSVLRSARAATSVISNSASSAAWCSAPRRCAAKILARADRGPRAASACGRARSADVRSGSRRAAIGRSGPSFCRNRACGCKRRGHSWRSRRRRPAAR